MAHLPLGVKSSHDLGKTWNVAAEDSLQTLMMVVTMVRVDTYTVFTVCQALF